MRDSLIYIAGRIFQLIGLIAMPSSMWAAEYLRSEPLSIGIFIGAILVFGLGWVLVAASKRK